MNKNFYANGLRNITAACLALVIFTTTSMIALASPAGDKSLMGELTVSGQGANASVLLNGEAAFTGRTFFSNSTIATTEDTTSTVKLGKLGYINLSPNTTLSLSFDEKTISGTLEAGQIKVFNADGVDVKIQNLNNANSAVVPVNTAKKDDDSGFFKHGAAGPLLVFAGIVTAVVVIVLVNNNNNNTITSPVR
ncbi:MAG: hypothetical protein ACR2HG_15160 [Pyrinomonadaceae bacterium]